MNIWNPSNFYILDECCLRKWQITKSVVVYNTWCWSKYWQLRVVFSCESCEWFSSAGTIRHHHHYSHRLIIDKWSAGHRRCVTFLMNRPISQISLHTALQSARPSAAATETCLSNGRLILIMEPVHPCFVLSICSFIQSVWSRQLLQCRAWTLCLKYKLSVPGCYRSYFFDVLDVAVKLNRHRKVAYLFSKSSFTFVPN